MKKCGSCLGTLDDQATNCTYCGASVPLHAGSGPAITWQPLGASGAPISAPPATSGASTPVSVGSSSTAQALPQQAAHQPTPSVRGRLRHPRERQAQL